MQPPVLMAMPLLRPDILVIGLDPAGIECALGAALARVPVVLVTQNQAQVPRNEVHAPQIGGQNPLNRLRALGGRVIEGEARFRDHRHVFVGEYTIAARRIVLALAAESAPPCVAGLEAAPQWQPGQPAPSVLVLGGNGRAPAIVHAARREGHRATLIAPGAMLPGFDSEAADALAGHLRRAGIALHEHFPLEHARVERCPEGYLLYPPEGPPIGFSHWHATLEAPASLESLMLHEAGIATRDARPVTGEGLGTTNSRILAVGATRSAMADGATARAEAALALANMLGRVDSARALAALPRIAHGPLNLIEAGESMAALEARAAAGLRYYRQPLAGGGMLKVVTDRKGRAQRVVVLARHAAGLAAPLLQLLADQRPLASLASLSLPALEEADSVAALGRMALAEKFATPGARMMLRLLRMLG